MSSGTEGTPDAPREPEDDAIDASASGVPPVPDQPATPDEVPRAEEEATPASDPEAPLPPSADEEQGVGGEAVPAEETPVPAEAATEPPALEQEAAPAEASVQEQEAAPVEPSVQEQAPVAPPPPAAEQAPVAPPPAAEQAPAEGAREELPEAPRARPEIPGADLIPDLMPPEQEEFLDAEARAAAEAEAEAREAREREQEEELQAEPIADAAIDLAAGARYSATGKRKSAVARVILKPGSGSYAINGKPLERYFPRDTLQRLIRQPLETVGYDSRMDVVARMHGGGTSAQAGALRHGISRALIVADPHLRGELKRRGYLTRDPRVKERKKAGLKKARKRPQFSKR